MDYYRITNFAGGAGLYFDATGSPITVQITVLASDGTTVLYSVVEPTVPNPNGGRSWQIDFTAGTTYFKLEEVTGQGGPTATYHFFIGPPACLGC